MGSSDEAESFANALKGCVMAGSAWWTIQKAEKAEQEAGTEAAAASLKSEADDTDEQTADEMDKSVDLPADVPEEVASPREPPAELVTPKTFTAKDFSKEKKGQKVKLTVDGAGKYTSNLHLLVNSRSFLTDCL
jgi:predicted  nucleic acid-binding Zn-ribbon protein